MRATRSKTGLSRSSSSLFEGWRRTRATAAPGAVVRPSAAVELVSCDQTPISSLNPMHSPAGATGLVAAAAISSSTSATSAAAAPTLPTSGGQRESGRLSDFIPDAETGRTAAQAALYASLVSSGQSRKLGGKARPADAVLATASHEQVQGQGQERDDEGYGFPNAALAPHPPSLSRTAGGDVLLLATDFEGEGAAHVSRRLRPSVVTAHTQSGGRFHAELSATEGETPADAQPPRPTPTPMPMPMPISTPISEDPSTAPAPSP